MYFQRRGSQLLSCQEKSHLILHLEVGKLRPTKYLVRVSPRCQANTSPSFLPANPPPEASVRVKGGESEFRKASVAPLHAPGFSVQAQRGPLESR